MYKSDPRQIVSRFDTVCAETGKKIKKGEECIYYPRTKKVYAMASPQATEFRRWLQDVTMF